MDNMASLKQLVCEFMNLFETAEKISDIGDDSTGMGSKWSREQKAAYKRLRLAQKAHNEWRQNQSRKIAYDKKFNELLEKGVSKASIERQLKSDPEFRYDYRLISQGGKIKKELDDATRDLSSYVDLLNIDTKDLKSLSSKSEYRNTQVEFTEPILDINSVKPLVWHVWPGDENQTKIVSYKPTLPGVGPGEERLAQIFGGNVQGGKTSYDIIMPDNTKWEVKQILTETETIRPGTEGIRAFQETHQTLNSVMREIKKFVNVVIHLEQHTNFKVFTRHDAKRFDIIREFIDENYVAIVHKGEIPNHRFKHLRRTLYTLGRLRQNYINSKHNEFYKLSEYPTITINSTPLKVPRNIFIDVLKYIAKETGSYDDIMNMDPPVVSLPEILFSDIKSDAFNDPTSFFNRWFDSIKPSSVFGQTQGIILVNPDSYLIVPRDQLDRVFKFTVVTQGRPRFQFNAKE